MRPLLPVLTNPRLTAALFLAFLALFCLGLVLPQRAMVNAAEYGVFAKNWPALAAAIEATGLDDVYRSPVMIVVFVVFVAQILAFLGTRAARVAREALRPPPETPDSMPIRAQAPGTEVDLERLGDILSGKWFRVRKQADGSLFAVKNRFSPLGSLAFHASFVFLLGGGWVLKAREFRGEVVLAEGQRFHGAKEEYLGFHPAGLEQAELPPITFRPEKIRPVFSSTGKTIDIQCKIRFLREHGRAEDDLGVNRPARKGGAEILLQAYGLAPVFSVKNRKTKRLIDYHCWNLDVWAPGHPRDSFRLQRPPATVYVRFFPDHAARPGDARSGSIQIKNPALELEVKPDDNRVPGAKGLVKPGETLTFGDYDLKVEELRTWGRFHISRQPGTLLIIGFLLMVAGISARLLFVRKWISARVCQVEGSRVISVGGRAELFPESFRLDLQEMLQALRHKRRGEANGK